MKTAVVYFSLGGATRSFARAEANARGADLFEAVPEKKYNPFSALVRGCHAAMRQKSVPLSEAPDLTGYGHIVLMAPVWGGFPRAAVQQHRRPAPARRGGGGAARFRQRKQ